LIEINGLGLINNGVTTHYVFQYDSFLIAPGGPEPTRTNAVIQTCEGDYNWLSSLFNLPNPPGIHNPPESDRINVYVGPGTNGATRSPNGPDGNPTLGPNVYTNYEGRPYSNDPALLRCIIVEEVSEMFMQNQNIGWYGWPGGNEGSKGEGLSRFLGDQFLLQNGFLDIGGVLVLDDTLGISDLWLNIESTDGHVTLWRQDYVNNARNDDYEWDAVNGCTTLFIYYLHDQLGFTINQIVAAGAPTLAGVYRNLTGDTGDPFPWFKALLDGAFPSQRGNIILGPNRDNPFPLSPRLSTTAPNNPASMVYNLQQHIFSTWTDGKILHIWYDQPSGNYASDQWTGGPGGRTSAPAAAGDPATMVYGQQQHIFYRGTDGGIYHVFWDAPSNSMFWDQWTGGPGGRTSAPAAAGDPATMVYGQQQHIFYRGTDGGIYHVFWDADKSLFFWDQWAGGPNALTSAPAAAGDPATMVYFLYQQQHIFYRGTDGAIYHVWWGPNPPAGMSNFGADQWTHALHPGPNDHPSTQAPPAAGDPATMVFGNQQHIFYRGSDGAINHVFWDQAFGTPDKWCGPGGSTSAPAAAGDPATMVYPLYQQQHIFYRAAAGDPNANDGGIYHVFWTQGPTPATTGFGTPDQWAGPGANTTSPTPAAAGDPATMVWFQNEHTAVYGNQQSIIYRGNDPAFPNGGIWFVAWAAGTAGPLSCGELSHL
jgi:hypothetical protein